MSEPTGTRSRHPWVRKCLQALVALALLTAVAHARHQTLGQLGHSAAGAFDSAVISAGDLMGQIRTTANEPDLTLSPSHSLRGARITVTGTGYADGEKVEIRAQGTVLATPVADSHGAFRAYVRIPADIPCPDSQCELIAAGKTSLAWTTVPYDVTG